MTFWWPKFFLTNFRVRTKKSNSKQLTVYSHAALAYAHCMSIRQNRVTALTHKTADGNMLSNVSFTPKSWGKLVAFEDDVTINNGDEMEKQWDFADFLQKKQAFFHYFSRPQNSILTDLTNNDFYWHAGALAVPQVNLQTDISGSRNPCLYLDIPMQSFTDGDESGIGFSQSPMLVEKKNYFWHEAYGTAREILECYKSPAGRAGHPRQSLIRETAAQV